ncbi:MFS transporter [Sphingomonas sp. SUN039]|uniref:MFS transporter n=1 Tax=Sphingomonas sp. SUN039 TaxID=2937787 RepID=UPI002164DF4C|nr:MFS transporter [Sphingomonas sp. SUN039]UVO54256.1 MFS transporter [Sphingomonas sp. SUN039]
MGYLSELLKNWRPLLAATIGLGCGLGMNSYVMSIMAPHLIQDFGWTRATFAAVGALGLFSVPFFPLVGRLTDMFGVRATAMIGVIVGPLCFFGLSHMNGDIRMYVALYLVQGIICITTTATVYARIVVQYVKGARGLALAIAASGSALTGAIGGPLLNAFVEGHGWRAGYWVVMGFTAVAGATALLLMPPEKKDPNAPPRRKAAREDYGAIFANRAFWVLGAAMILCNLPQVIALTQINLVLLANGVTSAGVTGMVAVLPIGVLVGRFISGLALDRFPSWIVAMVSLGLPAIGLWLIASPYDSTAVLTLAVLLIGLAFGAEGDLITYLVVQHFGVRVFSSVMGLMTGIISVSAALGAILISVTLKMTDGYTAFMLIAGTTAAIGSLLFALMPRQPTPVADPVVAEEAAFA